MKNGISLALACAMVFTLSTSLVSVPVAALDSGISNLVYTSDGGTPNDGSNFSGTNASNGVIYADPVRPSTTFYVPLGSGAESSYRIDSEYNPSMFSNGSITDLTLEQMVNDKLFSFSVKKDSSNSKLVNKVTLETGKRLGNLGRTSYLKFVLNDTTSTSELKTSGKLTFKARSSNTAVDNAAGEWDSGATVTINYTLWVSNRGVGNSGSADAGDHVYFDPDSNEENTFIWGDDRAALRFNANDDADKFYARLSTKADSNIYAEYGDPVGAELWFYDFVGNASLPTTSKATLTLGIPWDDDGIRPNPKDCFIYEKDSDGFLVDVTDKFTFFEDDEEIPGWSIKTRTLGSYILSDTELDLDSYYDDTDDTNSTPGTGPIKEIPNTGSSDMVGAAAALAAVSLTAAGAAAFLKKKK